MSVTKTIPNELSQNFGDIKVRRKLMDLYGDNQGTYGGVNENGEDVLVAIDHNGIEVSTFQENGWLRKNFYDEDGFDAGESYEGRWR